MCQVYLLLIVECKGTAEESSLRREAALHSVGTAVDTSVSLARRQQDEEVMSDMV